MPLQDSIPVLDLFFNAGGVVYEYIHQLLIIMLTINFGLNLRNRLKLLIV